MTSSAFHLMAKPTAPPYNLDCSYHSFLTKEKDPRPCGSGRKSKHCHGLP